MARNGYRINPSGYREVLRGDDALHACEERASFLAYFARGQSGTSYAIDSVRGVNRIHTRVSTTGAKDFYREGHYGALRTALGMAGGSLSGSKGYQSYAKGVKKLNNRRGWRKAKW